jgi:HPt (histidine-containing phosphotransfer) domain-containing protein
MMQIRIDVPGALNNLGGDEELLLGLATIFLEDVPVLMEQLQSDYQAKNQSELVRHVHSLIGLLSNFAAEPALELGKSLEWELGNHRPLAQLGSQFSDFHLAMDATLLAIRNQVCADRACEY